MRARRVILVGILVLAVCWVSSLGYFALLLSKTDGPSETDGLSKADVQFPEVRGKTDGPSETDGMSKADVQLPEVGGFDNFYADRRTEHIRNLPHHKPYTSEELDKTDTSKQLVKPGDTSWTRSNGVVTIMIYLTHKTDPQQVQRINELHQMFDDDLFIIWGGKPQGAGKLEQLFNITNIVHKQSISKTQWLAYPCCGTEMTIHWMLDNRDRFDYAWVMEGDVLWSSNSWFLSMLRHWALVDVDLLHQTPGMETTPLTDFLSWHNRALVNTFKTTEEARFYQPYYKSMYNVFRLSTRFLDELEAWYKLNDRRWVFFEPLFSTLAAQSRTLTSGSWMSDVFPGNLRFRPCFQNDEIQKTNLLFYHPVKANFENCAFVKLPTW